MQDRWKHFTLIIPAHENVSHAVPIPAKTLPITAKRNSAQLLPFLPPPPSDG